MSKRKRYIKSCEVSELVEITAGGYSQKILIEGFKSGLPVIIFLHGGPGSPVPFSCGCRGLFPEWSKRAITVYWDQLGCGLNDYKIDDSFTIDGFAEMTCDVINYVKNRFPENKMRGLILSPDYSLKDFKAVVKNGYRGNQSLWGELVRIDLREELGKITVPYYLFQGDTDIVTSTKTVLSAVQGLNNPKIRCEEMKNSGHMPSEEAMGEIFGKIYEII